jgi:hypothetical protein
MRGKDGRWRIAIGHWLFASNRYLPASALNRYTAKVPASVMTKISTDSNTRCMEKPPLK